MKFKAGDRVRIKSLDWYNENKNQLGRVSCGSKSYTIEMCFFCGKTLTIQAIGLDFYLMEEDNLGYEFTDEMIEGLVEEETKPLTYEETVEIIETMQGIGDSWECPQGYQFVDENGNIINATKIVLEKKKKEYPKTYEECCKILGCKPIVGFAGLDDDEENLYVKFIALKRCRDAYWKIAGEEMGLGKPWEPDWKSLDTQYIILYQYGGIDKAETHGEGNYILTFPTAEMRDAFKENFDPDIKICKELL